MLARGQQAQYDPTTGEIIIQLATSIVNGYQNTVTQYTTSGILSIPDLGSQIPNLDMQAQTQVQITGYSNSIIDSNYSLTVGEVTVYSPNWYSSVRIAGIEIQEAQTSNIENMMMGQSTNSVLIDILQMIIDITTYLNSHTHTGVQTGGGTSGIPSTTAPDDNNISSDLSYIQDNANLAITGVYVFR